MAAVPIGLTAFDLGSRFIGEVTERPGSGLGQDHPFIVWCHGLCGGEAPDEVPWCGVWLSAICWLLRLPRSKSKSARSWLAVGSAVELHRAEVGFDVVILKRGPGLQPGPDILQAPGHVGLFAGFDAGTNTVQILAGNQGNAVSVRPFPTDRVLGIRRLR